MDKVAGIRVKSGEEYGVGNTGLKGSKGAGRRVVAEAFSHVCVSIPIPFQFVFVLSLLYGFFVVVQSFLSFLSLADYIFYLYLFT